MVFTTLEFLIFFCIVFAVYYIVPKKIQWLVLLVASMYFYTCASLDYIIYLLAATVITYLGALLIDKYRHNKEFFFTRYKDELPKRNKKIFKERIQNRKKIALVLTIASTLGILIVVKYSKFAFDNISAVLNIFHINFNTPSWNLILPLGISFYTFMSIGYVLDVYREECKAEKNFLKYLLYISYFPHILQGPMDKYNEVKDELFSGKSFNYDKAVIGVYRIVVGIIKKMVVADKLALIISTALGSINDYHGINIIYILVLYAIQLYADFSGYMDIAIGCSKLLGIDIKENFDAPYFSKSIAEYWRRWHISLGAWFRDYVYYPLLRSKNAEKIRKKYKDKDNKFLSNNMPTVYALAILWLLIGFWHGSTWSFVIYGLFHGSIIIASTLLQPLYEKFYKRHPIFIKTEFYSAFQIARTFSLVLLGYLLFCTQGDLGLSMNMFKNIFVSGESNKYIFDLMNQDTKTSVILGTGIIFVLDWIKIHGIDVYESLRKKNIVFRWIVYSLGLFVAIMFASGTVKEFLYFQF